MDAALRSRSTVPSYRAFLNDFAGLGLANRLMRDAAKAGGFDGSWSIRHDVDYHLGRALLMAEIEQSLGLKSTFYLLPPGHDVHGKNYYGRLTAEGVTRSADLGPAARRLVEMGHEVGLHNDFIYLQKVTGVPRAELIRREIDFFAAEGVTITGTAAHGSRFSRRHGFVNYELFTECDRRRAHVYVDREDEYAYGRRLRDEGFECDLNAASMTELGLDYEAYFVGPCLYVMDSGGRLTARWFKNGEPVVKDLDDLSLEALKGFMAESGAPGIQLLVHADHWGFIHAEASASRQRGAAQSPLREGKEHTHLLPSRFLGDFLTKVRNTSVVLPRHYGHLNFGNDEPGGRPHQRVAREAAGFEHPPNRCVVLLQAFAGPDPDAVDRFTHACRARRLPYTLFTFARWRNPAWGVVEPYPLDWDGLASDVRSGLASVGYLHNALHLADAEKAYGDFEADVAWLRARGMDCRVMAPFPGPRPSHMPTLDEECWGDHVTEPPLCIGAHPPFVVDASYTDASLPRAARYRHDLNPINWFNKAVSRGRRVTISLHPQHYGDDLTLLDGSEAPWMRNARFQPMKGQPS